MKFVTAPTGKLHSLNVLLPDVRVFPNAPTAFTCQESVDVSVRSVNFERSMVLPEESAKMCETHWNSGEWQTASTGHRCRAVVLDVESDGAGLVAQLAPASE